MAASSLHATPYSGTWYPNDPEELSALLDELWRKSEARTGEYVLAGGRAFVVPHAGLVYSGTVAAAAYRHVERLQPERILLAGFAHRGAPRGIWIPEIEGFETPLGTVAVDRELADEFAATEPFGTLPESRLCDHSVEIQLPLLQKAAPGARVVPLYVSELDASARGKAARVLAGCMTPATVMLASSDLTHFGRDFGFQPFPVDALVADRLRRLDYEVIESAGSLREQLFLETLRETSATVCGSEPIALLLATLQRVEQDGEIFQETLDYQTSGEIVGDYHSSVSYGALGFFPHSAFELDPLEQRAALDLARRTLADYQATGARGAPAGASPLQRRSGLFVTLHKDGQLRGCIGRASSDEPLQRALPELTLAAALEDGRFRPVSASETGLEIEISILSPMKRLAQRGDFRVNQHGAVLKANGRQGLLLPQVATERNWGADQFFQALATKTGVGAKVYSDPATRIFAFRAQIIH